MTTAFYVLIYSVPYIDRFFLILTLAIFLFPSCTKGKDDFLSDEETVLSRYESGAPKETAVFAGSEPNVKKLRSRQYYETGQIKKEFHYRDNLYYGQWTFWYKDGKKLGEGFFKEKALNPSSATGRETYYWPNGIKMLEIDIREGKPDPGGMALFRDEAGREYSGKERPEGLLKKTSAILMEWEKGNI